MTFGFGLFQMKEAQSTQTVVDRNRHDTIIDQAIEVSTSVTALSGIHGLGQNPHGSVPDGQMILQV